MFSYPGLPTIDLPYEFGPRTLPIRFTYRDIAISAGLGLVFLVIPMMFVWPSLGVLMVGVVVGTFVFSFVTMVVRIKFGKAWPWVFQAYFRGDRPGWLSSAKRRRYFSQRWTPGPSLFHLPPGELGLAPTNELVARTNVFGRKLATSARIDSIYRGPPPEDGRPKIDAVQDIWGVM